MTTTFLLGDVAGDEGLRLQAYPDPLSARGCELAKPPAQRAVGWQTFPGAPWTIGYGHTGFEVHEGLVWSLQQARTALAADIAAAIALLDRVLPWWRRLNDARQDVLANMVFNMGWDNPRTPQREGLSGFTNTLAKIQAGDFAAAADGMLASRWARQVHGRAERLELQMRTGARA